MNRRVREPYARWCERRTPVLWPEPPTRLANTEFATLVPKHEQAILLREV